MTASTASEYRLDAPDAASPATAWFIVPRALPVSALNPNPLWWAVGGYTAATQESILSELELYTDEDVHTFAEEAEWTPELAERYRDFLDD